VEVLQVKTTDISRFSAWILTVATVLVVAACSKNDTPPPPTSGATGPLTVESVIFDPKVGLPGDTLLFTAVITSPSQNEGDYPVMEWTANGGKLVDTNRQTVRWAAPATPGVYTITAKATNDVNSSSNKASVYVGTGQNLIAANAGQIDLIGSGPDFRYYSANDISGGVDISKYVGGVSSDAIPPHRENQLSVTYSPDGMLEAYAADSVVFTATVRPRNIYIGDFGAGTLRRLTTDGANPLSTERNLFNYPCFSPNSQVIAYQRLAQAYSGFLPDSFHVYIQDLVAQKRTKVTAEHPYPLAFFPTFSTDSKWLIYVVDLDRSGQYELYGSPMSGNDVDGSLASLVRMTNTGGSIVTGQPGQLKKPLMVWNPVVPVLAIAAADNVLYLVQTTAAGANVTPVTGVNRAQELAWSADGSLVAVAFSATVGDETRAEVVTVSTAGVVTQRAEGLSGDNLRDMAFSPDGKFLLFRVTRGGGSWFEVADISAGKLSAPVPVTASEPAGLASSYRATMLMRPLWLNTNAMLYPVFVSTSLTPGVSSRDLSGLFN
jgi:hypothetical protein